MHYRRTDVLGPVSERVDDDAAAHRAVGTHVCVVREIFSSRACASAARRSNPKEVAKPTPAAPDRSHSLEKITPADFSFHASPFPSETERRVQSMWTLMIVK